MATHTAVVLSQGQSNGPAKRHLEETIVAELIMDPLCDVMVIPHLYDVAPDHPALSALQGLPGDFVLLSWLYPRAAHWTLDRHNIRGQLGATSFNSDWDARKKKRETSAQEGRTDAHAPRVIDRRPAPSRNIYHLDLRTEADPHLFIDEVKRIAWERSQQVADALLGSDSQPCANAAPRAGTASDPAAAHKVPARRWYPVIDYSRCTNCMECIDFCLFGVYGVDHQETILVEQPDNCRRGCPACSRVCPENAIIFPQHKTPVIAGDPSVGGEMKIDLSELFGKPSDLDVAARERDEYLRLAGREPVGTTANEAAADASHAPAQHDELDDLIDELDQMDL